MPHSSHIAFASALLCVVATGCAALTPISGIPANYLPPEFTGEMRSGKRTINLMLLEQSHSPSYLLDHGDVLAIYIPGVLPFDARREPPVYYPRSDETLPPSLGYPIPVGEDGSISMPLLGKVPVRGLTIGQVEDALVKGYKVDRNLVGEVHHVHVSLQRKRTYNVLVVRQESPSGGSLEQMQLGQVNPGSLKRGTGKLVQLPAYENDVMHALSQTGGLPGLDAENTIYVIRRKQNCPVAVPPGDSLPPSEGFPPELAPQQSVPTEVLNSGYSKAKPFVTADARHSAARLSTKPASGVVHANNSGEWSQQAILDDPRAYIASRGDDSEIVAIPMRLFPGEPVGFTEQDIILGDGDIVFVEARDSELFYSGGLLGGGQYQLPRDYDLDVLGAVAVASGSTAGGGANGVSQLGGVSVLNRDITVGASNVVIIRQLPDGREVRIKVDLYEAMMDKKHRPRILSGDYVLLQYKPHEAVCAYIERNILAGGLIGVAVAQFANPTGGSN